jgi:hypothetical protein
VATRAKTRKTRFLTDDPRQTVDLCPEKSKGPEEYNQCTTSDTADPTPPASSKSHWSVPGHRLLRAGRGPPLFLGPLAGTGVTPTRQLRRRSGGGPAANTPPPRRPSGTATPPLAGRGDADGGEAYGMDPGTGRAGGTLISHGRAPPTLQRRSPWPSGTPAFRTANLGLRLDASNAGWNPFRQI